LAQRTSPSPGNFDVLGFFNSTAGVGTNTVVLGAGNSDVTATNAGAAFAFEAGTGALSQTLQVNPFTQQFFGVSVPSHDGDAVVADLDPSGVHVYRLSVVDGTVLSTHAS